ncbi:MAG: hypothetical protein K0S74_1160 [Chlamydiales bacterium]|jgi:hypothetical protein|nr:hypothetical protein [Chlamydiales bacterium]
MEPYRNTSPTTQPASPQTDFSNPENPTAALTQMVYRAARDDTPEGLNRSQFFTLQASLQPTMPNRQFRDVTHSTDAIMQRMRQLPQQLLNPLQNQQETQPSIIDSYRPNSEVPSDYGATVTTLLENQRTNAAIQRIAQRILILLKVNKRYYLLESSIDIPLKLRHRV